MLKNKNFLIVPEKNREELVDYLLRNVDDEELMELNFNDMENLTDKLLQQAGNDLMQRFVDKKSKLKKRPKNIKIKNSDSKKKL